jgi:hypothetical protein
MTLLRTRKGKNKRKNNAAGSRDLVTWSFQHLISWCNPKGSSPSPCPLPPICPPRTRVSINVHPPAHPQQGSHGKHSAAQALGSSVAGSASPRLAKGKDRCQNHPTPGHTLGWAFVAPDQEAGEEQKYKA